MLPETFAPGAEILPSETVNVELALGSQLPLLVTMVTFQSPSYGVWAKAWVAAAPAPTRAKKAKPVRIVRINQNLEMWVMGRLIWAKCV